MRQTNVLFLLAAGVATAALQKLQPGSGTSPAGAGALLARQFNSCSSRDTCHDCFGDGYVICDTIGCFNPEIHQQCCKDACKCLLPILYEASKRQKGVLTDEPSALRGPDQQLLRGLGKFGLSGIQLPSSS